MSRWVRKLAPLMIRELTLINVSTLSFEYDYKTLIQNLIIFFLQIIGIVEVETQLLYDNIEVKDSLNHSLTGRLAVSSMSLLFVDRMYGFAI